MKDNRELLDLAHDIWDTAEESYLRGVEGAIKLTLEVGHVYPFVIPDDDKWKEAIKNKEAETVMVLGDYVEEMMLVAAHVCPECHELELACAPLNLDVENIQSYQELVNESETVKFTDLDIMSAHVLTAMIFEIQDQLANDEEDERTVTLAPISSNIN